MNTSENVLVNDKEGVILIWFVCVTGSINECMRNDVSDQCQRRYVRLLE